MPESTLDDRFRELRQQVDGEISRARSEVISELARAVSRMRSAGSESEWREAVLDSGRMFADNPEALELLGSLAALTAPAASRVAESAGTPAPALASKPLDDPRVSAAAERFARVKVAEIQLYQIEAVLAGRSSRDLYGTLKWHIDEAREAYRERFLSNGAEHSDYLHAEILHALANDDATLLGPNYPGPLA